MGRLTVVDGLRGFCLLFMAQHHFNAVLGAILGKINHENFGWVDVAQGFVFISGLVVGLVYGKRYLSAATRTVTFGPVLKRTRTIYLHQAALVLMLLAAALLLGSWGGDDLLPYREAPVSFTLASLLLLTASTHMGILPMYILFLLATPYAFRMLERGWVAPYAMIVLLLWTAGQTGLSEMLAAALAEAVAPDGSSLRLALGFNALAWQALYFAGLFFGFGMAKGSLDLRFLRQEQYRVAFFIALGAVVLLGVFDRVIGWDLLGPAYASDFSRSAERPYLAWIYPVAFLLDLFALVWMLQVGIGDRNALVRSVSALAAWLFTRRVFVFLGQHSLHVFSFHLIVYYLLATVMPHLELSALGRNVLLVAAMGSLYLAAYAHAWSQRRSPARPFSLRASAEGR